IVRNKRRWYFQTLKQAKGKRQEYKSSGSSSSFNPSQSRAGSFNLNTQAGDDEEEDVQEVQRPISTDMTKKKAMASSTSSKFGNEDALARLMVTEYVDLTQSLER
ncbi:hypothetical protein Tco_1469665, partial [Tanacetum coccineum]